MIFGMDQLSKATKIRSNLLGVYFLSGNDRQNFKGKLATHHTNCSFVRQSYERTKQHLSSKQQSIQTFIFFRRSIYCLVNSQSYISSERGCLRFTLRKARIHLFFPQLQREMHGYLNLFSQPL